MIQYGLIVSASTGNSINTAFSLVASNIPLTYQFSCWNETSFPVGIAFDTSAPTTTITKQLIIPAGGTYSSDSNARQPAISDGQNIYLRAINLSTTGVVSYAVTMDCVY